MIAGRPYRISIVGASSLAGKELADCVADSALFASDVVLLDEDVAGQLTSAGDEVAFIQKIDSDSFAGMDFVFFADDPAATRKYWKTARSAGASIVDMTYALERESGVVVRGPWACPVTEGVSAGRAQEPDLTTPAVVSAHPAAVMLLLIAKRLHAKFPVQSLSATVFEPASEHGRAAMDELHQQTVSLLSFQSLPREQYDAQVAFNLLPSLGEAAKVNLAAVKNHIAEHYAALAPGNAPELTLQLVQAPLFHGYSASVLIALQGSATVEQVELAMYGEHVDVVGVESDPPSNLSAAGQSDILVRVSSGSVSNALSSRLWLWLAADNLKLAALNAIACANELRRLRPQGKVQ
ncbi:MAG: segregation protein B [Acidobacteriota bacterium]|nr:segregation protein B [Acidobacteriota bacterium]